MIIGITGHAQHGKDTTGQFLVTSYGFKRYAFADQLRSMALTLNPIIYSEGPEVVTTRLADLVQSAGWDVAKKDPEVRRFLQVLGTEAVRDHLGEDAWVDSLDKRLNDDDLTRDSDVVITDVRFLNEVRFIRRNGGEVWRVKRLEYVDGMIKDFDNGLGTDHPSERFINSIMADRTFIATEVRELLALLDNFMKRRNLWF